jgi:hypothetical protein
MCDIDEFIIAVFLVVDSALTPILQRHPPRRKGAAPALSDSEALTLEIVGEFLGHHDDAKIWRYFHQPWQAWFPGLSDRPTFVRQASSLGHYKQLLQPQLLQALGAVLS